MTWEQKFAALCALDGEAKLAMRKPGDWYVANRIDIGGDGFLVSASGNGASPQYAVEALWSELTENLPPGRYLVVRRFGVELRVRWNGYMWLDVPKASA